MLNFSIVNSPRVNRRCVRNWPKIFTNAVVCIELFLLVCGGKPSGLGKYFFLQSLLLVFIFSAFCKGLSLNEGLQSVMKCWLANNQS